MVSELFTGDGRKVGEIPNYEEAVNHPPHYTQAAGVECIDVIEALGFGFCDGNALKYLWRYRSKGKTPDKQIEDLRKAIWYIERQIQRIEYEESQK